MGGVPFLHDGGRFAFKIGIVIYPMFFQSGEGLCGQFQVLQLCPMLETALFGLEIVKQADTVVTLLRLSGRSGVSGDPGGDGVLRVVHTQGFHSGKPLLIRGAAGHIFSPLYLIALLLQAAEQIFKICGDRYKPVNGRFQLCLVTGSGLGCRMLDIALALVPS